MRRVVVAWTIAISIGAYSDHWRGEILVCEIQSDSFNYLRPS